MYDDLGHLLPESINNKLNISTQNYKLVIENGIVLKDAETGIYGSPLAGKKNLHLSLSKFSPRNNK